MAYVDALLQLASGQTVTGASSVLSTNTIDLSQNRDIGAGEDLYGRFQVGTAFAGVTALEFQIIAADDAALTTNVAVLASTGAIPVAQLVANARFAANLSPRIGSKGQRYVGARFVPTGTGTAGTVTADIGLEVQDGQKFYPGGFAVL
jgi:hypothetical protein